MTKTVACAKAKIKTDKKFGNSLKQDLGKNSVLSSEFARGKESTLALKY
jgi:hypothetical protein